MDVVQNGGRTTNHDRDHDRDHKMNGINGGVSSSTEKSKGGVNGRLDRVSDTAVIQQQTPARSLPAENPSRMNDLPDEIQHITENFLSLSQLFSRLAQKSHNELADTIMQLAKKPLPMAPMMNGNVDHGNLDDSSVENIDKKVTLLRFAQDQHAKWVKALVIAEWSKKATQVSKLIDVKAHLHQHMTMFDLALDGMMTCRRSLAFATLPSPDLKTALQVLSTGSAPWISDFNYIEPPPMTAREQLRWLDNLNTLLSLRLEIDDHDKIPYHFRNYKIASGRVTFIVKGEFEVDLTIGDEDFEKQFWFIDFRFLFSPAPAGLSDSLRAYLELKVNDILATQGLEGCYKFLHEFVLTHKVTEMTRQAVELSRARWVDTVKVERLNRSMAVQYWTSRFPSNVPKSWIIIGVHSGVIPGASPDPRSTSYIALRWFRGNREIKESNITLDVENISMETILKAAIARHIEHILSSIHSRLLEKPVFAKREAALDLRISRTEPTESSLTIQLTGLDSLVMSFDPITGFFAVKPHSRITISAEQRLNSSLVDRAEDGVAQIEIIRNVMAVDELQRRGRSLGWSRTGNPPVKPDEYRHILSGRETYQAVWFRRQGWGSQFYILISLSLSGDQWWLVELGPDKPPSDALHQAGGLKHPAAAVSQQSGLRVRSCVSLPFTSGQPSMASAFFTDLSIFVASIISNMSDLRELHARKIGHFAQPRPNPSLPRQIRLPTIFIRLSEILPSLRPSRPRSRAHRGLKPWARDYVRLTINGVHPSASDEVESLESQKMLALAAPAGPVTTRIMDSRIGVAAQASLRVTDKSKFRLLSSKVDHDVFFNHRIGEFTMRVRAELGESMVDALASRLQAIERLVEFLDSISRQNQGVECETITLRKVVFTYGFPSSNPTPSGSDASVGGPVVPLQQRRSSSPQSSEQASQPLRRWRVWLDLAKPDAIKLRLEPANPHIRVLDMLQTLINTKGGLETLPFWLPTTLPVAQALERIDECWIQTQKSRKGSFDIFNKTLDWTTIRYSLNQPNTPHPRKLNIDVRLRSRRGEPLWLLSRIDPEPAKSNDEFARIVKRIWDGKGTNWKGLGQSAAAYAAGIEGLLLGLDQSVRLHMEQVGPQVQHQQQLHQQQQQGQGQSQQQQQHHGAPPGQVPVPHGSINNIGQRAPQSVHGRPVPGLPPGAGMVIGAGGQIRQQNRPVPPHTPSIQPSQVVDLT